MIAWRLCNPIHAETAFSGEGARITGGRWNSEGVRMVYCASHVSLAVLEMQVQGSGLLPAYSVFQVEIPNELITTMGEAELPDGWREGREAAQPVGNEWIKSGSSVGLVVPSAVIPREMNLLLNPSHPDFNRVTWTLVDTMGTDERLM